MLFQGTGLWFFLGMGQREDQTPEGEKEKFPSITSNNNNSDNTLDEEDSTGIILCGYVITTRKPFDSTCTTSTTHTIKCNYWK